MVMRLQRVYDWSGGMNTQQDAWLIPQNASTYLENAIVTIQGKLSPKLGVSVYGDAQPSGLSGGSVAMGLGSAHLFYEPWGIFLDRSYAMWDSKLYRHTHPSGPWQEVYSSFVFVDGLHLFCPARNSSGDYLMMCHSAEPTETGTTGAHSSLTWHRVYPPSPLAYGQVTGPDMRPGCFTWWQGRAWCGNVTTSGESPDKIYWSALWDATDYSLTGWSLQIDPERGGPLMAMTPSRSEVPSIYVFKRESIYALDVVWSTDGYIPTSANDLDTTKSLVRPLTYGTGCIATGSVKWVPTAEGSDVYFLGSDGIRSLRRVEQDTAAGVGGPPLTYKVPDLIERINWKYARRSTACATQDLFMCSVPIDTATYPNAMLVKSLLVPAYDGWGLWVNNAACLDEFILAETGERHVHYQRMTQTGGSDTDRKIYELSADDTPFDEGGVVSTMTLRTRSFDHGQPLNRKHWRWMEVHYSGEAVDSSTGATLSIAYARDEATSYSALGSVWLGIDSSQSVKYGLEDVWPSYRLQLELSIPQDAKIDLRLVEVVAEIQKKEW